MMRNLCFTITLLFTICSCTIEPSQIDSELQHKTKPQKFNISMISDTLLVGEQGTLIEIKEYSFVDVTGNTVENAEVLLEEYYTISDFVRNRLSTQTIDGKILRSSGMVNITAKSEDKEVFLKNEATLKLGFPRVQESNVANLFQGKTGSNGEMIWEDLDQVHVDTTVIVEEYIEMLAYGADEVAVYLRPVIGNDTLEIADYNDSIYSKYIPDDLFDLWSLTEERAMNSNPFDKDRFYIFKTLTLGWLNCDIFLEEELFQFTVHTDIENSEMYIILDSLNSVIYPGLINDDYNEFSFQLPKNLPITISAYCKQRGNHYFAARKTNSAEMELTIQLLEMELGDIEKAVKDLNVN